MAERRGALVVPVPTQARLPVHRRELLSIFPTASKVTSAGPLNTVMTLLKMSSNGKESYEDTTELQGQAESLVPPYTRGSVSLSLDNEVAS